MENEVCDRIRVGGSAPSGAGPVNRLQTRPKIVAMPRPALIAGAFSKAVFVDKTHAY